VNLLKFWGLRTADLNESFNLLFDLVWAVSQSQAFELGLGRRQGHRNGREAGRVKLPIGNSMLPTNCQRFTGQHLPFQEFAFWRLRA
jgi:hypothetical protein